MESSETIQIMAASKNNIAIFSSHNGSNFQKIVESCNDKTLNATVKALYCNNSDAYVLERANDLAVPYELIPQSAFEDFESWDQHITKSLLEKEIHWVVLAGFMKKLGPKLLKAFDQRIINTHPSLLPKYGGKGMYGDLVHKAVLEGEEKETGISIHFVTDSLDEGQVIAQKTIEVYPGDTVASLSARVKRMERKFYIETLKDLFNPEVN
jgi:phosphoribosylglycinamide formyltransferase-1